MSDPFYADLSKVKFDKHPADDWLAKWLASQTRVHTRDFVRTAQVTGWFTNQLLCVKCPPALRDRLKTLKATDKPPYELVRIREGIAQAPATVLCPATVAGVRVCKEGGNKGRPEYLLQNGRLVWCVVRANYYEWVLHLWPQARACVQRPPTLVSATAAVDPVLFFDGDTQVGALATAFYQNRPEVV